MNARAIRYIQPDAIWAAMLASAAVLLVDYQLSCMIILMCFLWFLTRDGDFWGRYLNFAVFIAIGYFAAHRFDVDKVQDWLTGILLPMLVVLALLRLHTMPMPAFFDGGARRLHRLLRSAKLHGIPFALLTGTAVSLLVGDMLGIYGGITAVLIILLFLEERLRLLCGLAMLIVHVFVIELSLRQGLILLKTDTISFVSAQWDQFAAPFLVLFVLFVVKKKRSPEKSEIKN